MKVLIQHGLNGMFYGKTKRWTRTQKRAMVFRDTASALRHCLEHGNKDVLLWVCFKNAAMNFSIAPFQEKEQVKFTSYFALQESMVQQAHLMKLGEENLRLRKELDSIIAQGKERRKARKKWKDDGTC